MRPFSVSALFFLLCATACPSATATRPPEDSKSESQRTATRAAGCDDATIAEVYEGFVRDAGLPRKSAVGGLITEVQDVLTCARNNDVPLERLTKLLKLDRTVMLRWYNADPAGRRGDMTTEWGEHYLEIVGLLEELNDVEVLEAQIQLADRMLRVDASLGKFTRYLSTQDSVVGSEDADTAAVQALAAGLQERLLAELAAWRKLPSAASHLKDATYSGTLHLHPADRGGAASRNGGHTFVARVEWITLRFQRICELWRTRSIPALRDSVGAPYYAFLDAIIGRWTGEHEPPVLTDAEDHGGNASIKLQFPVVPSGRAFVGDTRVDPPTAAQALAEERAEVSITVSLHDLREQVLTYDDKNLRGLFEAQAAANTWRTILVATKIDRDEVPAQASDVVVDPATRLDQASAFVGSHLGQIDAARAALERAMAHTESHRVRATYLSTLVKDIRPYDRDDVPDPDPVREPDASGKLARFHQTQQAVRVAASKGFATTTLCLLNRAMLQGSEGSCRPSASVDRTTRTPCERRALRPEIRVSDAGVAYGTLVGVLSMTLDNTDDMDADVMCELQSVLHPQAFLAFDHEILRYRAVIELFASKGLPPHDSSALGAILVQTVDAAKAALTRVCINGGLGAECSVVHLGPQSGQNGTTARGVRDADARVDNYCGALTLAAGALGQAVGAKLHTIAANHLAGSTAVDIEYQANAFKSLEELCKTRELARKRTLELKEAATNPPPKPEARKADRTTQPRTNSRSPSSPRRAGQITPGVRTQPQPPPAASRPAQSTAGVYRDVPQPTSFTR